MTAILNTAILNLAIFDSFILVCPLKLTHTYQDWFPPFAPKNFTHFFWLNLMIAAILNSANLNSTILDSTILVFPLKLTHTCQDWFPTFTQKILHSLILTQLDDGSHLEFGNLGFNHLSFSSQTHSHLPRLVPNICTKKLHWFILTQLDDCSYLEICHPQFSHFVQKILHSFILTQLDDGSHLEVCHLGFSHFAQKELHSFILTQLDDGSHFEFCHLGFSHLSFSSHTSQD